MVKIHVTCGDRRTVFELAQGCFLDGYDISGCRYAEVDISLTYTEAKCIVRSVQDDENRCTYSM